MIPDEMERIISITSTQIFDSTVKEILLDFFSITSEIRPRKHRLRSFVDGGYVSYVQGLPLLSLLFVLEGRCPGLRRSAGLYQDEILHTFTVLVVIEMF